MLVNECCAAPIAAIAVHCIKIRALAAVIIDGCSVLSCSGSSQVLLHHAAGPAAGLLQDGSYRLFLQCCVDLGGARLVMLCFLTCAQLPCMPVIWYSNELGYPSIQGSLTFTHVNPRVQHSIMYSVCSNH